MQNDSPVIDFSRPVLWWYAVHIARMGGDHHTFVRALSAMDALVKAKRIRDELSSPVRAIDPRVSDAKVGGVKCPTTGRCFAGYADE